MRPFKARMLASVATVGLVALASLVYAQSHMERADCPGKIVCPQTGKLICRDKCPMIDQNRPDCPGQVVCPLTGKLVCKDRCPLGGTAAKNMGTKTTDAKVKPACCAKKG